MSVLQSFAGRALHCADKIASERPEGSLSGKRAQESPQVAGMSWSDPPCSGGRAMDGSMRGQRGLRAREDGEGVCYIRESGPEGQRGGA